MFPLPSMVRVAAAAFRLTGSGPSGGQELGAFRPLHLLLSDSDATVKGRGEEEAASSFC